MQKSTDVFGAENFCKIQLQRNDASSPETGEARYSNARVTVYFKGVKNGLFPTRLKVKWAQVYLQYSAKALNHPSFFFFKYFTSKE